MARSTKDEAEKTRSAILTAAEDIFYKRGVTHTSLGQIATAAGVTRGAIYWHFKNKIELCEAMMLRFLLPQEAVLEKLTSEKSATPLADLCAACCDCLHDIARDKHRKRTMSILMHRCEYVEDMAGFLKRSHRAKDRMLAQVRALLEHAEKRDMLAAHWSPRTAAIAMQSLMMGLIHCALEGRKDFDLAKSGVSCVKAFFRSLGR